MERTSAPSHPQPRSRGYPERVRMSALEFQLAETLGGTAKPGWSPRKGRRLSSFLGAGRNTADQPFLLSTQNPQFRASLVLQLCALASQVNSTARKVGQIIAQGGRRWLIRVYLGRDHETDEGNSTTEPFRVQCAKR
jgi:hypothetical protein